MPGEPGDRAAQLRPTWRAPGRPSYGEVWALDPAAIYALDAIDTIAYELDSGSERWRLPNLSPPIGEPWLSDGETLYTGWEEVVTARSVDDGDVRWEVHPPLVEPSWITGRTPSGEVAVVSVSGLAPTD